MTGAGGQHLYSCHSSGNPIRLRNGSSLGYTFLSHEVRIDRRYRGSLYQKSTEEVRIRQHIRSACAFRLNLNTYDKVLRELSVGVVSGEW